MMRFAGDYLAPTPVEQKPVLPSFNPEDLEVTPEMTPGPYYPGQDLQRDKYIRHNPKSGVAQGFKDGQEVALAPLAPAIPAAGALIGKGIKAYSAFKFGQTMLDGGAVNPGTKADYANQDPTNRHNRHKQNNYTGPATRSPYHQ